MERINFSNLPSTTTPLNATNLNQLQTNVDNGKIDKSSTLVSDDLNNATSTGIYMATSSCANIPISSTSFVVYVSRTLMSNDAVMITQTAYQNSSIGMFGVYGRTKMGSGEWGPWINIAINNINNITDWNNAEYNAIVTSSDTATHAPAPYTAGMVWRRGTDSIAQLGIDMINNKLFIRNKTSATAGWKAWKEAGTPDFTSNTNGVAIKFPDGTMICRLRADKSKYVQTTEASGTFQGIKVYRSNMFDWVFPVEFYNNQACVTIQPSCGTSGSRFYIPMTVGTITTTHVNTQLMTIESPFRSTDSAYTNLTDVTLTAIGQWK